MGYTTTFSGQFTITPPIESVAVIKRLRQLSDGQTDDLPEPLRRGYCQWVLNNDFDSLAWDGNEKFYNYVEWLQYVIDNVLTPAGNTLSGNVRFQGEDRADRGTIAVENGRAVRREASKPTAADLAPIAVSLFELVEQALAEDSIDRDWTRKATRTLAALEDR